MGSMAQVEVRSRTWLGVWTTTVTGGKDIDGPRSREMWKRSMKRFLLDYVYFPREIRSKVIKES